MSNEYTVSWDEWARLTNKSIDGIRQQIIKLQQDKYSYGQGNNLMSTIRFIDMATPREVVDLIVKRITINMEVGQSWRKNALILTVDIPYLLDSCIDEAFKILVDTGIVEHNNGWFKRVKA